MDVPGHLIPNEYRDLFSAIKLLMVPEQTFFEKDRRCAYGLTETPSDQDTDKIATYINHIAKELCRYTIPGLQKSGLKEIVIGQVLLNPDERHRLDGCAFTSDINDETMLLRIRDVNLHPERASWSLHHEMGHFLHREAVKVTDGKRLRNFHNDIEWKKLTSDGTPWTYYTSMTSKESKDLPRTSGKFELEAYPCVSYYGRTNEKEDIAELHALAMTKGPDFFGTLGHCADQTCPGKDDGKGICDGENAEKFGMRNIPLLNRSGSCTGSDLGRFVTLGWMTL